MSLQSGKGDFPVYRGVSRQYGNGLGSIFKAALRTVIPILKPVAKASLKSVKKVAKDEGVQALKDIVGGENVKKVLKQRGKTALKTELDMESIPPTMTTMQGTQWNDYHPIASLDSHHAPIEFPIPPHTEFYTDLSQAYLYIKFRILKQTGEDIDTDAKYFQLITFFIVCSVALICISTIN